ncbi:TonB-dependent receptor [Frateuria aurantia]
MVSSYRASLDKAIDVKKNATSIVDAISAEDVGKFPDTNVAESLSHISGVTVDRQFGEGEKVSILGTDPALNRVLVNGETIASTSWGGDPNDPDSRSFNYTILPSQVIGLMEVYKTPQAKLDEGSIGGTVIVHTRHPLDMPSNTLTGSVSYGYNDRADKGKPNGSLLYSWHNQAKTLGFLVSATHDERVLRRDGIEVFGYDNIGSASFPAAVKGNKSGQFPTSVNTAIFQQDRDRNSVSTDLQWKPSERFDIDFTGIGLQESYNNFNQSRYAYWDSATSEAAATALNVNKGVATSGSFGPGAITYLDGYSRYSTLTTGSANLKAAWHGDDWNLTLTGGYTKSTGGAQDIYGIEFMNYGGYSYDISKGKAVVNYNDSPTNPSTMTLSSTSKAHDPQYDRERYLQLDFDKDVSWGPFDQVLAGVKATNHAMGESDYSNTWSNSDESLGLEDFYGGLTPSGFLNGITASQDMKSWATINQSSISSYINSLTNAYNLAAQYSGTYAIQERTRAAYVQGDFDGDNYRGNIGMRYVYTRDGTQGYSYDADAEAYSPVSYSNAYHRWLPSLNFAYDLREDVTLRVAASKVIARPRYSDLTPYSSMSDSTLTASTGNPYLKPYESMNYDASAEWYATPDSLLSAEYFHRSISNYILDETFEEAEYNQTASAAAGHNVSSIYEVTQPVNGGKARVDGMALAYQGNIGAGFGISANYTYSHASTDGSYSLPYNSKHSINFSPYYEKGKWLARISAGWRSAYFTQIGRLNGQQMTAAFTELDANVDYTINRHVTVGLSATNLLDETYYSYIGSEDKPYYIYKNGRTLMMTANFKL